jgi:FkbM family methyltransferase
LSPPKGKTYFMKRQINQLRKVLFAIVHPACWKPLTLGVGAAIEHIHGLRGLSVDGIIDVGANVGQFSLACRILYPNVPIVAFEPIPDAATLYRKVHGGCRDVTLNQCALGTEAGTAVLHLSRSADSSSLLPIGELQTQVFPKTEEVGTIEVPVARLDDFSSTWSGRKNQLLKLDVQGFELNVLLGSQQTLQSCRFVYVECSEIQLYQGQAVRQEVSSFLESKGFKEAGRFNAQFRSGSLIQADYLFEKVKKP